MCIRRIGRWGLGEGSGYYSRVYWSILWTISGIPKEDQFSSCAFSGERLMHERADSKLDLFVVLRRDRIGFGSSIFIAMQSTLDTSQTICELLPLHDQSYGEFTAQASMVRCLPQPQFLDSSNQFARLPSRSLEPGIPLPLISTQPFPWKPRTAPLS